jgi:hypothetical protein
MKQVSTAVSDPSDVGVRFMQQQVARTRSQWLRTVAEHKPTHIVAAAWDAYQEAKQAAREVGQ